jgi:hypothetical protein
MKHQKEQQGVRNVKKEVHQVMPPGLQSKELHIQHMGKPGQRMPIRGVG